MSNQWFRLYTEIMNDPKVLVLTEALRWRYVALLCLHNDNKYENAPDDEVSLALRITIDEWIETRNAFLKRGLITADYKISGWDKRQYISDRIDPTASERQHRYREKKRNERNESVTSRLPEAETDSDTETESKEEKIAVVSAEKDLPDLKNAFDDWNRLAGELKLPKAQMLDASRKTALRGRLRECGGLDGWAICLGKIRGSPFLRGEIQGFRGATFDWITAPKNFKKIMEGNYDDNGNRKQSFPKYTATERAIIAGLGGDFGP